MNSWSNYVGQEIAGRYRLESLTGVGSFGAVYAAVDTKAHHAVMLRLLPAEMVGPATFDATVLTDFRHPQAVAVSDVGGFQDSRFLVMPRVAGARIQVRDPWPVERVLEFVRQVSAPLIAFQKLHDLQHLHLHPGNVFVEESAGKPRYQVADLGLASQVGAGPLILEAIRERRTTPEFLSPEQLQGNVPSLQSDVYAVGAMLFQLLSGLPPFPYSGESLSSYALHVAKTPPPRFRDVNDQLNIDPYIESIILRCLSKSPEARPGSIQEFVDAYEMAYRDFQTRTLSGLKLSELDALPAELPVATPATPIKPTSPPVRVPAPLPASDMLPDARQLPARNEQIPYRALPHGTDTMVEMPRGQMASRAVLQESQAILQTVNPQLSPWSGMGGESPKPSAPSQPPRPPAGRSMPENSPPPQPPAEKISSQEPSMGMLGTMSPNVLQEPPVNAGAPQRREVFPSPSPEAFQPPREPEWGRSSSGSVPIADARVSRGDDRRHADQTMSPASESVLETPSDFGGRNDANLTMQMQQDWLRSQGLATAYKPVANAPTAPMRQNVKRLGPPNAVLILLAAIVVAVSGLGLYGYMAKERVHKQVEEFVTKDQYNEAKDALRMAHPLVGIWINRDDAIEQLLTDGLKQVEQRRESKDLAAAVKLTGELEAAFAKEDMKQADQPKKIRQELATVLRDQVLELAGSEQLKLALEKAETSDEADAFRKVANHKKLPDSSSDFDVVEVKRAIFRKVFVLADKHTENGNQASAFKVLDAWRQKLFTDDHILLEDREKLKERHCEARVLKTLDDAREEARPERARFVEALGMLDNLLRELGTGSCSRRRPAILHAQGQLRLAWAETKVGTESEIGKRFEDSLTDLTEAIEELEKQPAEVSASRIPPTKTEVLKTRAAVSLARGLWNESRTSVDKPTQPIRDAIRDFKAALVDAPKLEEAQHRLQVIRETAQPVALEVFGTAQTTKSPAEADRLYCDAIRQLTLVIEGSVSQEDDGMARSARLLRGLARSSLQAPDYENGIEDLSLAVTDVSESQLADVSEHLAADLNSDQRIHRAKHWFAVARARLAWLAATCDQSDLREKTASKIRPVELAQRAAQALEDLINDVDRGSVKFEDKGLSLAKDCSEAWKAHVVALMNSGEFEEARLRINRAQSYLVSKDEVWKADRWAFLEHLRKDFVQKERPYRVKPPTGAIGQCSRE